MLVTDLQRNTLAMAYCNDSFVDDEPEELTRERKAIEGDIIEECNDVNKWNMDRIITKYKHSRSERKVNGNNLMFGAENVLQLPENFSEMDKIVLLRIRNMRRHAVHIYDVEKFKETFGMFLSLIHAMNH